ncbi:MAG: cellulase family glycosylhydrolase, partial [Armatimonadota bacterium]|nr:cellulase family glycosylhydrolase [Armatimonadota bacterium]
MVRSTCFTVALLTSAMGLPADTNAAPLAPTFPFEMPAFDSTPTPVDMSHLNPEPAGKHGFIRVKEGHFVDGTGKRIRFLGTNVTFQNAFPPKETAPKVAARMRKLGMNIVRFHHMDNAVAPRGIWLPNQQGLDPEQLDRLDWFIYQLREHGIYANINLHVSRNYPGLPADAARSFNYGKVLDNFHRPFIDMQKEYARALLTHVNKYTGNPYTNEPAIAAVEINNENTLLGANWSALRAMPEPFLSDLAAQWRGWLKTRYGNTASLRRAWRVAEEP